MLLICDFIKDDDGKSFLIDGFHCDFLNPNVIFGDLRMDAEPSAAEYKVSHLNEGLSETFFIEFTLLFLDVVFKSGKEIPFEDFFISETAVDRCEVLATGFDQGTELEQTLKCLLCFGLHSFLLSF